MTDTDIYFVVTPNEATRKPQAIHLKHFKALGVSSKSRPSLTTL